MSAFGMKKTFVITLLNDRFPPDCVEKLSLAAALIV